MKELIQLFLIFFRIGLFSIGGGYVMLPLLRREMVESRGWLSDEELIDFYAIAQATPGIIAINTATFVGFRRKGVAGALSASFGMVSPSLIIITTIALFFDQIREVPVVERAFRGIRIAVAMLLGFTLFTLIKKTVIAKPGILLFLAAFTGVAIFDISPVPILITAAVVGITLGALGRRLKGNKPDGKDDKKPDGTPNGTPDGTPGKKPGGTPDGTPGKKPGGKIGGRTGKSKGDGVDSTAEPSTTNGAPDKEDPR